MDLLLYSTSLEWFSIIIIAITTVYFYFVYAYNFWKRQGVKQFPPTIPLGNIKDLILLKKSISEVLKEIYDFYPKEPVVGMYEVLRPGLLIRDPELIKQIIVKDFSHFQDRGLPIDEKLDPLSENLMFTSGTKWNNLRVKLTPTFTSGKLKMMFHHMQECSDKLMAYLEESSKRSDSLEMLEIVENFAIDIIGSCVFGLQLDSLDNSESEFCRMLKRLFDPKVTTHRMRVFRSLFPSLKRLFKIKALPEDVTNFFMRTMKEVVEYREKNNVVRNDFLQLLIHLKNKRKISDDVDSANPSLCETSKNGVNATCNSETDIEFTDGLLTAQAYTFFLAGYETSSKTIGFCLYELALNPEIQTKLRQEIDNVLKRCDAQLTFDALQSMSYLDKVVNETLRKHTPVGYLVRAVTKPYVIPGTSIHLDVRQRIFISVNGLHHDPEYYPEPEKFNPENFNEEAKHARPHYTYLPFGEGPRICIGMRFGLLEAKLALFTLLSRYKFSVCEKTEKDMKFDPSQVTLSPLSGIWLRVTKL